MSELNKCPFCGNESVEIGNCMQLEECAHFEECPAEQPFVCVVCGMDKGGCGASSGYYDSEEKAIAAWNRRSKLENARAHARETGICPMCEDCPDGCPVETPKDSRNKMTNAQRIRGMSDEELAEMLTGDREWLCEIMCGKVTICGGNCKEKALNWLRQPAETEGTE